MLNTIFEIIFTIILIIIFTAGGVGFIVLIAHILSSSSRDKKILRSSQEEAFLERIKYLSDVELENLKDQLIEKYPNLISPHYPYLIEVEKARRKEEAASKEIIISKNKKKTMIKNKFIKVKSKFQKKKIAKIFKATTSLLKKHWLIVIIIILVLVLIGIGIWQHQHKKYVTYCEEICIYSGSNHYWVIMRVDRSFQYQEQCIDYCLSHLKK